MLPRSKRLTTSDVSEVLTGGVVIHSPLFTIRAMPKPGKARFAVVVSKKVAKTAVLRNKIRRKVYSSLQKLGHEGFQAIILVKHPIITARYGVISETILKTVEDVAVAMSSGIKAKTRVQ